MNTLLTIGYQAILFEGTPASLFEALSKASVVNVSGYGKERIFEPDATQLSIELIQDTALHDDRPVLEALHKAQTEANDERNRRYRAESELKKLKEQFHLEEESK